MRHGLARFGIEVSYIDLTDPANLVEAISEKQNRLFRNARQPEHALN